MNNSIYIENGYESRQDYLQSMSDEYGVTLTIVKALASMLGSNEDFDGLINELEDYAEMVGEEM